MVEKASPFPLQFGNYMLLSRIGTGGMAEVFLARNTASGAGGKRLVLKKMLARHRDDAQVRGEFLNEARLMSLFMHPNVMEVTDFGEVEGFPFIVMEHIHGRDLATVLDAAITLGVTVPDDVTFYVVAELLEGLAAVHAAADRDGKPLEIVHGDVNPANVFISYTGEVKIGDFGIAKTNVERKKQVQGVMKGKIGYLAPEQIERQLADPRTDIFSAGIVLWEMLAGRRLFTGRDDYDVLQKIVEAKVPPIARGDRPLPVALERIVAKGLEKDPKKRYQRAAEFAAALNGFVAEGRYKTNFQILENFMGALFAEQIEAEAAALEKSARYAGRIEERSLVKVVADLIREEATGRLHIQDGPHEKNFFFKNGVIFFCTSNMKEELLGEFLVREAIVTRAQLDEALAFSKNTFGKLGDALIAKGILPPHTLLEALQRQVKGKVTQAFGWTAGSYVFHHGDKCHDEALPLDIGTISLIAEGIRKHMTQEHLEAAMGSFLFKKPVFHFSQDFNVDNLALTGKELRVYRSLSGSRPLNDVIAELTAGGKITTREVLALPYLLCELGVLSFE